MERKSRLSTSILDRHGKVGPFFFKEAWMMVTVFIASCAIILVIGGFVYIPFKLILYTLGSIITILILIRFRFVKRINSPWYMHKWAAHAFFSPKRVVVHTFPFKEEKMVFIKRRKSLLDK
ncbi:MAG: hypothetical protein ACYC2U_00240 [Candidatus Amoebophilus sp.]